MGKVEVHRSVLIGLAAAFGCTLLALVFLLGREAGRRGMAADPAASAPQARPALSSSSSQPKVLAPAQQPGSAAVVLTIPPGPADPQDPQRPAVQAYFAALDRIAPGQLAGDPQALAQEMVVGLGKGDTSGFDRLLAQAEEARRKVAQLSPPPPLAAYHQESLALLDENLALLGGIRRALEGGHEEGALPSLVGRAQAAQARSEALERADKALRARYGAGR